MMERFYIFGGDLISLFSALSSSGSLKRRPRPGAQGHEVEMRTFFSCDI